MSSRSTRLETKLIHAGEPRPRILGAGIVPIFRSTVWENLPGESYHDIRYPRLSNLPNHVALHGKLAALEGAEAALVTASGMAAISSSLLAILGSGDHMLVQDCVYGGTHGLITQDFPPLGIEYDFVDGNDAVAWAAALRPTTRAFYVETLANPLLDISDHEGIVAFAREHGLVTLIDSTFASPINFRPLEWGFDLVIHSCTKYLNGHSDLAAGCVAGSSDWIERIKHKLDHLGGALDPHGVYLLHRGVKTLAVRLGQQNRSAALIAEFLDAHPRVRRVRYPGLLSHPQHERARKLLDGFGGMLSFELDGGAEEAERFIGRAELPLSSASLGGVETLITRPAATSHAGLPPEERERLGITEGLIRLSVGIEATPDLIDDLGRALE